MEDQFKTLYETMAQRKYKPDDCNEYNGGNGRVDRCVKLFQQGTLKTGGTLMDVGAGIADLGFALKDKFVKRIAIDISETNLRAAKSKGNEVFNLNVDALGLIQFDSESVDVITGLDFIEHLLNPQFFLKEAYRVLKPGGQIFLNTPNFRFWRHLQKLVFSGEFPYTSGDTEVLGGGHIHYFTFKTLEKLLKEAGFNKVEQINEPETFENVPSLWTNLLGNVDSPRQMHMELGNSNLLMLANK